MEHRGKGFGHGNSMNEALLHVPPVIKYPSASGVGPKEVTIPVSLADLFPTIMDLFGMPLENESVHGKSLLDLAGGASREERYLYADYQLYHHELSSVRRGSYKLVVNLEKERTALHDTRRPRGKSGERSQKIIDEDVTEELKRAFEAYAATAEQATRNLKSTEEVDPEAALEHLRSLGYVR